MLGDEFFLNSFLQDAIEYYVKSGEFGDDVQLTLSRRMKYRDFLEPDALHGALDGMKSSARSRCQRKICQSLPQSL